MERRALHGPARRSKLYGSAARFQSDDAPELPPWKMDNGGGKLVNLRRSAAA